MHALKLGPFLLDRPIARGGTGVVWRGRHAEQGVPVAVKILDRGDQQALRREVLAVAALNHTGIVLLYDYGMTSSVEMRVENGTIPANAPWLAMELASMGSIKDIRHQMTWNEIRGIDGMPDRDVTV